MRAHDHHAKKLFFCIRKPGGGGGGHSSLAGTSILSIRVHPHNMQAQKCRTNPPTPKSRFVKPAARIRFYERGMPLVFPPPSPSSKADANTAAGHEVPLSVSGARHRAGRKPRRRRRREALRRRISRSLRCVFTGGVASNAVGPRRRRRRKRPSRGLLLSLRRSRRSRLKPGAL